MKPGSWCEKPLWSWRQTCEREQVVERRDRPPPRDPARDLQPLRVLVEHRVDDVDERLVAVEERRGGRSAGSPRASPGRGARSAPPSRARPARGGRRPARRSASHVRSVASNTAPSRFDAVSSGPKTRNVSRVGAHDVAQEAAQHARRLARRPRRRRHVDRVVAEVRQREVAQQLAAVGVRRWRPCGARPSGACATQLRHGPAARRRTAPRAGRSAATPRACARCSGFVARARPAAPGASARCPRPARRRPRSGPVQPFGRAQHDHRPARPLASHRRRAPRAWIAADLVERSVERRGERLVDGRPGRRPSRTAGAWP